ncbi:MAG: GGDEF domain-containing protein, partial [Gammaproteobacteria bacterium]|nr:GGDEF domain-containing protein [Gammaproteobacteria bacterium]
PQFEIELSDGRYSRVNERRTDTREWVFVHTDISDLRTTQRDLEQLATHDALTGLLTRKSFEEHFERALVGGQRHSDRIGLMFIDIDNFKEVNDRFGHPAGDCVLLTLATRLRRSIRDGDTAARLGGDEFVIVLTGLASNEPVELAASRVLSDLRQPVDFEGTEIGVTVSIGVSLFPEDGGDKGSLLASAEKSCHDAKERGRNAIAFASPKQDQAQASP